MKNRLFVLGSILIALLGFALAPAYAGSTKTVNVPPPTGDWDLDWLNIQAALNHAGPGDTVRLAAGRYQVHKPISIEGFEGTLEGTGRDITIVEAVRVSQGQGFELIDVPNAGPIPVLFWFDSPHRRINIENMTLQVLNPEPSDPYDNPWVGVTTNLNNLLVITGGECEVQVKNVTMKGAPSVANASFGGKNLNWPLTIERTGSVTVQNSQFEHAAGWAIEVYELKSESTARIEHNMTYECQGAVYGSSAGGTENIKYSIANNHFHFYSHGLWGGGVVVGDYARLSGEPALRVTVVNNTFSGASRAVLWANAVDDLEVADNRIVGFGEYALRLRGCSNSRVVENDAAGFVASVASISLTPSWGFPADNNLIMENTLGDADEAAIICAGNGNTFEENRYTGYYPGWPGAGLWWFQEGSTDNKVVEPGVQTEPERDQNQIRTELWRDDGSGNRLIFDSKDS